MDDRMPVDVIHGRHDAILELLFGCNTNVAQDGTCELGKETFDEVQPGSVLGGERKFEATRRLLGEPSFRLLGDVRGMIVEDQLDRRAGWVSSIDKLQKFNEFATTMAVLYQSMDLAGHQVDASQQADRTETLIFMIAGEGRMPARLRRQVRRRAGNRLEPRLLVIGDDRNGVAGLVLRCGFRLPGILTWR
jgi:hypothetical protein